MFDCDVHGVPPPVVKWQRLHPRDQQRTEVITRYSHDSASKRSIQRFVIMEKAPTGYYTAFTFKTLLRHYAKWVLTPRSLNVKLGPRCNYHEGRAAIRHYVNKTARPL